MSFCPRLQRCRTRGRRRRRVWSPIYSCLHFFVIGSSLHVFFPFVSCFVHDCGTWKCHGPSSRPFPCGTKEIKWYGKLYPREPRAAPIQNCCIWWGGCHWRFVAWPKMLLVLLRPWSHACVISIISCLSWTFLGAFLCLSNRTRLCLQNFAMPHFPLLKFRRFLYFLRAVQKSESAMCPPIVKLCLVKASWNVLKPYSIRVL